MGDSRSILFFLAHSNIFLGFGAASLILFLAGLFGVPFKWQPAYIAFSETFFLYSLNRLTDVKEDGINYPERMGFFQRYGRMLLPAGSLLYLGSLAVAYINGLMALIFTLAPFIIVFLYGVLRFKKVFIAKDIIVALGWSTIPLLFWTYYGIPLAALAPLIAFLFLRVLFTTIVFDVKDVKGDKAYGISTVPEKYGLVVTKLALCSVNFLCLAALYFAIRSRGMHPLFYALLVPVAYSTAYLASFEKLIYKPHFYDIIVDGEYAVLGILALVHRAAFA